MRYHKKSEKNDYTNRNDGISVVELFKSWTIFIDVAKNNEIVYGKVDMFFDEGNNKLGGIMNSC